jgi:hypothetical protein
MKNQVIEQHARHPGKGRANYIESALEFSFIFHSTAQVVDINIAAVPSEPGPPGGRSIHLLSTFGQPLRSLLRYADSGYTIGSTQ